MKMAPIYKNLPLMLLCLATMAGGAHAEEPSATANPPPVAAASTRVIYTFPFTTLSHGAPVVQAKIDDTATATFLIDTGSGANIISQAVVDKLGLKPQIVPQIKVPSFFEGKQATFVSPQKVLIGSLTLQGGAYVVLPAKTLATMTGGAVDGILSMQILRYFAMDLDFARHQVTMWFPNGLNEEAVQQAGFSDASAVSLIPSIPDWIINDPVKVGQSSEAYWNLTYSVPVQIGDGIHTNQQNLMLDTGSGVTVFPSAVTGSLNLKTEETSTLPNMTTGLQRANVVQAPSLQIGGIHIFNHLVGVFQSGTAVETPLLGVDILSAYRVLMDFRAEKMYFKPNIPQIKIGTPLDKKPMKN